MIEKLPKRSHSVEWYFFAHVRHFVCIELLIVKEKELQNNDTMIEVVLKDFKFMTSMSSNWDWIVSSSILHSEGP